MENGLPEVGSFYVLSSKLQFSCPCATLGSGAADDASHKIYIWDLAREGLLASTLDGGRELLTYVHVCVMYSYWL